MMSARAASLRNNWGFPSVVSLMPNRCIVAVLVVAAATAAFTGGASKRQRFFASCLSDIRKIFGWVLGLRLSSLIAFKTLVEIFTLRGAS